MPGVSVPAGWNVSYYNVSFGVTLEPIKVSLRPVYDPSGRTVIYVVETLTLTTIVTPGDLGDDTEAVMETLRSTLTKNGGELRVEGAGYGELVVNSTTGGGARDVTWGPKPRMLSHEQIGDDQAQKITWQVETAYAEACPDETLKANKALYWTYAVSYSMPDVAGLTTRRITGKVAVPLTKKTITSRTLDDNVDRLRVAAMGFPLPSGFRREARDFSIAENKCEATFSLVDQQMQWVYAPPKGVLDVQMRHSMDSVQALSFFLWTHSLSAEYRMGRTYSKSVAVNHFLKIFKQRRDFIQSNKRQTVIPLTFSLSEDVYTEKVNMAIRWTVAVGEKKELSGLSHDQRVQLLEAVIPYSGLFQVPIESDWAGWANSLNASMHPRGVAQMKFANDQDFLVDICLPSGRPPELKTTPIKPDGKKNDRKAPLDLIDPPAKNRSWLRWRSKVRVIEKNNNAVLSVLPFDRDPVKRKTDVKSADDSRGWTANYAPGKSNRGADQIIQQRGRPLYVVEFEGEALRANYDISPPELLSVGGKTCHPINGADCGFRTGVVGDTIVPLVGAAWRFRYVLDGVPTKAVGAPASLMYGTPTDEGSRQIDFFTSR